MSRATVKTVPTDADVDAFLAQVPDPRRRADALTLNALLRRTTGEEPVLWGTSIVGFGTVPLPYRKGPAVEWPVVGFAPRKAATVVYLMDGFEAHTALLERLGSHTTGRACLYLKRLDRVDLSVLEELIRASVAATLNRTAGD